jgi:hypothetical protein
MSIDSLEESTLAGPVPNTDRGEIFARETYHMEASRDIGNIAVEWSFETKLRLAVEQLQLPKFRFSEPPLSTKRTTQSARAQTRRNNVNRPVARIPRNPPSYVIKKTPRTSAPRSSFKISECFMSRRPTNPTSMLPTASSTLLRSMNKR